MASQELIQGFRKELSDIQEVKKVSLDNAFLQWYLDTRFGANVKKRITDGKGDGGIDAVVFEYGDKDTYLVQSQFCNDIFAGKTTPSPLSLGKYKEFDSLPDTFRNESKFDAFLDTVAPARHQIYRQVAKLFREAPSKVVWILTTLHSRSRAGENRLRNLDTANTSYFGDGLHLYELSLEGATPPAEALELNFTEHFIVADPEHRISSYVAQVYIKDFLDYIEHDTEFRVLARNVRSELRDRFAVGIKEGLRKTYLDYPWEFWYSHNGITIICDKASIKEGKKLHLISPYIINGAQTLHALKGLAQRDPQAKILVRVIQIPAESGDTKKFINSIIFRTNQQNRMYIYNLRANDTTQVDLARDFLLREVFYERRSGDWDLSKDHYRNQGIPRLKITELGQILVSCRRDDGGVAVAKRRIEDLFSEPYYSVFDAEFEEIFFKYKLYSFVKDSLHVFKSKRIKPRQRNHALLSCFAIAWRCLESDKRLGTWYRMTFNNPGIWSLQNKSSRKFKKSIHDLFVSAWRRWREENRKDETVTQNNFFKSSRWNEVLVHELAPKFESAMQKNMEFMFKKDF